MCQATRGFVCSLWDMHGLGGQIEDAWKCPHAIITQYFQEGQGQGNSVQASSSSYIPRDQAETSQLPVHLHATSRWVGIARVPRSFMFGASDLIG